MADRTSAQLLASLGLPAPDLPALPDSPLRFPDGAHYRIEIPSTEGPRPFRAVLDEAARLGVPVVRVSQGSGVFMHTDAELDELASLGRGAGVEVSLFARPNAGWGPSAMARAPVGPLIAPVAHGMEQLVAVLDDVRRAAAHGIRLAEIAAIRAAVDVPLDVYVECPDNLGGIVRYHELPDLVRVAAPVYLKFGLRGTVDPYPAGSHVAESLDAFARERVRRARLGLDLLVRAGCDVYRSSVAGAPGLALPVTARAVAEAPA